MTATRLLRQMIRNDSKLMAARGANGMSRGDVAKVIAPVMGAAAAAPVIGSALNAGSPERQARARRIAEAEGRVAAESAAPRADLEATKLGYVDARHMRLILAGKYREARAYAAERRAGQAG